MPIRKPVLGYSTKREAFAALKRAGKTQREASVMLGWKTVPRGRVFHLPADVAAMLEKPARERKMSASDLAAAIIFAAAEDGLIDGILDDR